jgi:predicted nuclease of predicted toxin-antitoxin system
VKLKLDENVPGRVETMLRARAHDVDTVRDEGRAGQPDTEIARAASHAGRMLITLDRGFPAPTTLPQDHPGVIVLRPGNQSAPIVEAAMSNLLDRHDLSELWGCIVIVSPSRIRIRRTA